MASAAAAKNPGRRLAETVFVTDPATHDTVVLKAGTEVLDPALAEQITHPDAWIRHAEPPVEVAGPPEGVHGSASAAERQQPTSSDTGDTPPSTARSGRRTRAAS